MGQIKVLVSGACGRMGREVVRAVSGDGALKLVSAVDKVNVGRDIGEIVGVERLGLVIKSELAQGISEGKPDVMVDFTRPETVMENIRTGLKAGVHVVVGTTGLLTDDLQEIKDLCSAYRVNALVAPNFAVGALLMMRCAAISAKYFSEVEIIELHHDRKLDAPSGTAIKTAEMIMESRGKVGHPDIGEERIKGVRGGEMGGIRVHSIRLPGLIAHQEVIFGGEGQTLTIRHDSLSRESFMPGVILGIKKVIVNPGLTYGLDHFLFED